MSSAPRITKLAPIGCALATLTLASCALPPKQAWQKIREDGLISYISYEMRTPRHPLGAPTPVMPVGPASKPIPTGASGTKPMLVTNRMTQPSTTPATKPAATETRQNSRISVPSGYMSPPEGILTAQVVPSLPGFVRSPYTNPPRLIDVKNGTPGSTMICPYTQKPFVIPGNLEMKSDSAVASAPPRKRITNPSSTATTPAPKREETVARKESTPNVPLRDLPSSTAFSSNSGASSAPSSPGVGAPQAPANKPAPEDIPYGAPIVGRPGYVNSPHAASHQLVDVTGLPVGMEVKCPYTGKVFRVPPQEVAASKPATPPTSAPEEGAEKK